MTLSLVTNSKDESIHFEQMNIDSIVKETGEAEEHTDEHTYEHTDGHTEEHTDVHKYEDKYSLIRDKRPPHENCRYCGEPIDPVFVVYRFFTPLCSCRRKELLSAKGEEEMERRAEDDFMLLYKNNPRLKDMTFEKFEVTPENSAVLSKAKDYGNCIEDMYEKGEGMIFFGRTGTGKSHMAAAILHRSIKLGYTASFQAAADLLSRIRDTYSTRQGADEETEGHILKSFDRIDFLVIDDLGSEKHSEWSESMFYKIINRRYMARKPVIITTNLTPQELKRWLGERTFDRLIEVCKLISCTYNSYRVKTAMKRKNEEKV